MKNKTIDIEGKQYYLDLNQAMKWISECPSNESNTETEIRIIEPLPDEDGNIPGIPIEIDDEQISIPPVMQPTKEVVETKSSKNEQTMEIRRQLVTSLLSMLFQPGGSDEDETMQTVVTLNKHLTFNHKLVMNTFLEMGILKVVETK